MSCFRGERKKKKKKERKEFAALWSISNLGHLSPQLYFSFPSTSWDEMRGRSSLRKSFKYLLAISSNADYFVKRELFLHGLSELQMHSMMRRVRWQSATLFLQRCGRCELEQPRKMLPSWSPKRCFRGASRLWLFLLDLSDAQIRWEN